MAVVAVSTSSFGRDDPAPLRQLREAGYEVRLNPHGRRLRRHETSELLRDAEGLIAGTEALDAEILAAAAALRAISRCGAGLDNVDLDAAAARGIRVRNTPGPPAEAVAELALAGILALLRRLGEADRDLRAGRWRKPMGRLLRGKTVGIIGLGRVGKRLVELLQPFDTPIVASDPAPDAAFAARHQVRWVELERLLAEADVISLHPGAAPGSPPLLGRERLERIRPGAVLINTARGGLVDEAALYDLLAAGKLAGAYLDVFADEPYDGALRELPQVLLSPHIGSYAAEARARMEAEAVANLLEALRGEGA